jgi:hypothetical protein
VNFDRFKKAADLAKLALDSIVAVSDVRARRRVEKRKAEDDKKDREIEDLKKELAALKEKLK